MDIESTVRKHMVKYIIQRNIFCPVSGKVLDIRTAKYFVDKDGDPAYVVSPEVYDGAVKDETILQGLYARGLYPMEET